MSKIYFTIAGTKHHYGSEFMEQGMGVKLVKGTEQRMDGYFAMERSVKDDKSIAEGVK